MSRIARSARGEMVDFDLLAIANQLAAAPPPVTVGQRRAFIDEKEGIRSAPQVPVVPAGEAHDALSAAILAADESKPRRAKKVEQVEPTADQPSE